MIVCQWHLDVPFGKQGEVVKIMKAWEKDNLEESEFRRRRSSRLMVGHIGASPSHIVAEHEFESLADLEAALAGMSNPKFQAHAQALAPLVVPGSQHWKIFKVIE